MEALYILKPSLIESAGVGCFATTDLEFGTRIHTGEQTQNRRLPLEDIPDTHLKYCPLLESGLFLAPANFATMSVMWYINHSREPNIEQKRWHLYAARDIAAGEEIYLYYPDLLTHPKNTSWVNPDIHV